MFDEVGPYISQILLILIAVFTVIKDWKDFETAKTGRLSPAVVLIFTFLAGALALQQTNSQIVKERKTSAEAEALTKEVGALRSDNKTLQSKLDAANQTLLSISGIQNRLAVPWLKDRNDHNQEAKDKRKAARFDLARLISLSESCVGRCQTVGPPGSGGISAEMYLSDCRAWSNEARGYIDGSFGESYKQRFLAAPYSQEVLTLDSNLNKQTTEEITQTLHQIMGQAAVLKQFLNEIPPD